MKSNTEIQLSEKYSRALAEAVAWISAEYTPLGIVAAGTIIRGNPDPNSDLDMYVITDKVRQRVQKFFNGVPCEIFCNEPARIRQYFAEEYASGFQVAAHMLGTGVVMAERDPVVAALREEARAWLQKERPSDPAAAQYKRYIAACLFEDYLDTNGRDPAVAALFLVKAVDAIIAWYFHDKRMFLPREKDKLELLRCTDATIGALVDRCLGEGTPQEKMPAALQLADATIGVRGFFEWESVREEV